MDTGKRNWAEVSGGSDNTPWKPQATEKTGMAYDPNNPNNFKEGYLAGVKEIKGKDSVFTVFEIQTMNPDGSLGEVFDIIGDTVNVNVGSFCCNSLLLLLLLLYFCIEFEVGFIGVLS